MRVYSVYNIWVYTSTRWSSKRPFPVPTSKTLSLMDRSDCIHLYFKFSETSALYLCSVYTCIYAL